MSAPEIHEQSVAALIARYLKSQGVKRVYGLCGGHIMPIWMRLDAEGIRIIDVRDERAAVYMAHAEADLTGGLGVALVTAGPGVSRMRMSLVRPCWSSLACHPCRKKIAVRCKILCIPI